MSETKEGIEEASEEAIQSIERIGQLLICDPANNKCADCEHAYPEWASMGFGIFICLQCAGYHRSIGTHVTAVRSLTLDEWTAAQVNVLEMGGNQRFWDYLKSTRSKQRYNEPLVLYYIEVLRARIQNRPPKEYEASDWSTLASSVVAPPLSPKDGTATNKPKPLEWIPDSGINECMVCNNKFTFMFRKHHCRKCSKVVCGDCAPANNTRPIMEWGMKDPVRHCRNCYKSPAITWKELSSTKL